MGDTVEVGRPAQVSVSCVMCTAVSKLLDKPPRRRGAVLSYNQHDGAYGGLFLQVMTTGAVQVAEREARHVGSSLVQHVKFVCLTVLGNLQPGTGQMAEREAGDAGSSGSVCGCGARGGAAGQRLHLWACAVLRAAADHAHLHDRERLLLSQCVTFWALFSCLVGGPCAVLAGEAAGKLQHVAGPRAHEFWCRVSCTCTICLHHGVGRLPYPAGKARETATLSACTSACSSMKGLRDTMLS